MRSSIQTVADSFFEAANSFWGFVWRHAVAVLAAGLASFLVALLGGALLSTIGVPFPNPPGAAVAGGWILGVFGLGISPRRYNRSAIPAWTGILIGAIAVAGLAALAV